MFADLTETYAALAEKYHHAPGSFDALVDAYAIPGEPELSMAARRLMRKAIVYPGDLVAGSLDGRAVMVRRLLWRAAYELTDWSIENIAEMFGYSPGYVRPWATSWRPFEIANGGRNDDSGAWWHFWGPSWADLAGVPILAGSEPS